MRGEAHGSISGSRCPASGVESLGVILYASFRRRYGLQRTAEERVAGLLGSILEHSPASAVLRLFARMVGAPSDARGGGGENGSIGTPRGFLPGCTPGKTYSLAAFAGIESYSGPSAVQLLRLGKCMPPERNGLSTPAVGSDDIEAGRWPLQTHSEDAKNGLEPQLAGLVTAARSWLTTRGFLKTDGPMVGVGRGSGGGHAYGGDSVGVGWRKAVVVRTHAALCASALLKPGWGPGHQIMGAAEQVVHYA